MADEPKEVDWEQLHLKVTEELELCLSDNGDALVTSAFQLPWPGPVSYSVLSNVGVKNNVY